MQNCKTSNGSKLISNFCVTYLSIEGKFSTCWVLGINLATSPNGKLTNGKRCPWILQCIPCSGIKGSQIEVGKAAAIARQSITKRNHIPAYKEQKNKRTNHSLKNHIVNQQ